MKIQQVQQLRQNVNDGEITIPGNETPLIKMTSDNYCCYIAVIVNFLRCGCPSVQLVDVCNREWDEECFSDLEKNLKAVQLPKEEFVIEKKFPVMLIKRQTEK